jgi:beta-galactosidase
MVRKEFPENFKWGVSQSGFQFEMGDPYRRYIDVNTDWWHWVRDPKNITSKLVSGDLPEEGINYIEFYRHDHEYAKNLGMNIYRLGIEWSRIFPYPTTFIETDVSYDGNGLVQDVKIDKETLAKLDKIANRDAVAMYRAIIQDLRSRGFKVIVNLFHFTLPFWLHDPIKARETNLNNDRRGLVEESFPIEFAKYAAYIAWKIGDLVDMWSSMNEPMVPVELGLIGPYTGFPPGVMRPDVVPRAMANIALAHALAYEQIKRFDTAKADADSSSPAEVGIIHNIIPAYPADTAGNDRAVEHYNYFHNTYILDAITKGQVDLELDEKTIVKANVLGNKLDWLGVNYYTRIVVREQKGRFPGRPVLDFDGVAGYGYACVPFGFSKIGRPCDGMGWEMYPEGLLDALKIGYKYASKIYVTEHGVSDARDILRSKSIVNHLYILHEAIESGIPVRGYLHWALTDNYEWPHGFRQRFGLYEVDLLTKERRPRKSVSLMQEIISGNSLRDNHLSALISFHKHSSENI